MIETIFAAAAVVFALLCGLVGVVVWLVRLEGKVETSKAITALAGQAIDRAANLGATLAVVQAQLAALEQNSITAHAISERLSRLETLVERIAHDLERER